jgi:hypothetical protein
VFACIMGHEVDDCMNIGYRWIFSPMELRLNQLTEEVIYYLIDYY